MVGKAPTMVGVVPSIIGVVPSMVGVVPSMMGMYLAWWGWYIALKIPELLVVLGCGVVRGGHGGSGKWVRGSKLTCATRGCTTASMADTRRSKGAVTEQLPGAVGWVSLPPPAPPPLGQERGMGKGRPW